MYMKKIYTVGMVLEDPSMYLSEVCHELEEAMGGCGDSPNYLSAT